MGEEGHVMLLLAGDLGCDLRLGRTFRTPQRGFWRQGLAMAGAKAGSHDTHDVTWPRCNSLGHRPENSCCGGKFVALLCLRKTPCPPQCRSMYMRQNYPPGDV